MKKTLVLEYTTGSRMFGLETPESDFDLLKIYIDPASAIEPSAKTTTAFQCPEDNTEGIEVELVTFMRGLRDRDLKYIEALLTKPQFKHNWMDTTPLVKYVKSLDMTEMYRREIMRRYNKTWYKEINPQAKNYNADQGYDSKFAAHLYRVLVSAVDYLDTGDVRTDFSDVREMVLAIRSGEFSKEMTLDLTTQLKDSFILDSTGRSQVSELPFPADWYFKQVSEFYF